MTERFDKAVRAGVSAKGLVHYERRLEKAKRRGNARKIASGRRILLDNSRVYVRFLPFVSGRVHLGRLDSCLSTLWVPLEPRREATSRPCV